jgi:hypothetical protein
MAVNGDASPIADDELRAEVSTKADKFIATFDKVCHKHDVKKVHVPGSSPEFPKKLKLLQQAVHQYSRQYHAALDCNKTPNESTIIRLACAQKHFKKANKEWQVRVRQQFYAGVVGDLIANDHKRVWSKLQSQVKPSLVVETVNPVKDKEGVIQYHADRILQAMKTHYKDLLMYDPDDRATNSEYWDGLDLGEPKEELEDLNEGLWWPEILFTIRGMNCNTAPGKDEVHINVLKIMVREECMAAVQSENQKFKWPNNVYINLSEIDIKQLLKYPLTNLGKSFHALLTRTWQTGCIPEQWQEVHIVNLFKGGDSESTNNYRGISLISCALKVLFCLMANRLSKTCEGNDLLCMEQAGFRLCDEAVAQATALAEIVWRRFLEGCTTLCTFVDFKKAYDRVYHAYLFRLLNHVGVCGRFLRMITESYTKTKYSVHVGTHLSAAFTPTRGAKQGDPLSLILFDIFINSCLQEAMPRPLDGVLVKGQDLMRCKGLMYADDIVLLSDGVESTQRAVTGIYDWGKKYGMDLGRDKCGVLLCKGKEVDAVPRRRVNRVLDFESDNEEEGTLEQIYTAHKEAIYGTPEGTIPTVSTYKYLGITMDKDLSDSRKVVVSEQSMEYKFALLQSKKGMRQLHELQPFLTDRFCPVHLKVALVRNLVYPTMLYGAEFIGFQMLHANPLQRVVNIAAKWILGLASQNTTTDAFTLCYELGLLPIFLEMSAAHARLGLKLNIGLEKLKTWIQQLFDNPACYSTRHQTWVTQMKKWLERVESEKYKYAQEIDEEGLAYLLEGRCIVEQDDVYTIMYFMGDSAPLRPWAQIGHCLEMRVRDNQYRTKFMERLLAEMAGEWVNGGDIQPSILDNNTGLLHAWWDGKEFKSLGEGLIIPEGRTHEEVKQLLLVQHVVLEQLMAAQKTIGWGSYDKYNYVSLEGS